MSRHDSSLRQQIARRILSIAAEGDWEAGRHLRQVALARQLHVSRSPVRDALASLVEIGAVEWRPNRGFFLRSTGGALASAARKLARHSGDRSYLRIAADRLAGKLPERVTESLLQRRYRLSRDDTRKFLARMAQEGWIARRPGYGWTFLPVLTSPQAYEQAYRFRMAIEPAALLEPTYCIDSAAFARCREQQRELIEGRIGELTSAELFELGSQLHETLVAGSNNPFFIDAMRRVNRLRRLIEYRAMVKTAHFIDQARDHLRLLDLIEGGDRERASQLLRQHLDVVRAVKLGVLQSSLSQRQSPKGAEGESLDEPIAYVHF